MKNFFVVHEVGAPVFFDHGEGGMLCPTFAITQQLLAENFGQKARYFRLGDAMVAFQHVGCLYFCVASDENEGYAVLKRQLYLLKDLVHFLVGKISPSRPAIPAVTSVLKPIVQHLSRSNSNPIHLMGALDKPTMDPELTAQFDHILTERFKTIPDIAYAVLFSDHNRVIAQYHLKQPQNQRIRATAPLTATDLYVLSIYVASVAAEHRTALAESLKSNTASTVDGSSGLSSPRGSARFPRQRCCYLHITPSELAPFHVIIHRLSNPSDAAATETSATGVADHPGDAGSVEQPQYLVVALPAPYGPLEQPNPSIHQHLSNIAASLSSQMSDWMHRKSTSVHNPTVSPSLSLPRRILSCYWDNGLVFFALGMKRTTWLSLNRNCPRYPNGWVCSSSGPIEAGTYHDETGERLQANTENSDNKQKRFGLETIIDSIRCAREFQELGYHEIVRTIGDYQFYYKVWAEDASGCEPILDGALWHVLCTTPYSFKDLGCPSSWRCQELLTIFTASTCLSTISSVSREIVDQLWAEKVS